MCLYYASGRHEGQRCAWFIIQMLSLCMPVAVKYSSHLTLKDFEVFASIYFQEICEQESQLRFSFFFPTE